MRRLLAMMLLAALAVPAVAQDAAVPASTWKLHVGEQLSLQLAAADDATQERALQLVIELARRYDDLDLSATVPDLLSIYRWDRDRAHRMMALAALHAVGDDYGMTRLAELAATERSHAVRKLTFAAVADHRGR